MHRRLKDVAEQYARAKQLVIDLEGETAISGLTMRTVNDIRHALDHVLIGIALEIEDAEQNAGKIERHYDDAVGHLDNFLVNSYEIIAGKALTICRERINTTGIFSRTGKAKNLFREAVSHYNRGRALRTEEPEVSLDHLQQAAVLSIEVGREVEPATRGQRILAWVGLLAGIATIVNLGLALYQWFSHAG